MPGTDDPAHHSFALPLVYRSVLKVKAKLEVNEKNSQPHCNECCFSESDCSTVVSANCTQSSNTAPIRGKREKNQAARKRQSASLALQKQQHDHTSATVTDNCFQFQEGICSRLPINETNESKANTHISSQALTLPEEDRLPCRSDQCIDLKLQKCFTPNFNQNSELFTEKMDMKYADITHMQLKRSLDKIHVQNCTRSVVEASSLPRLSYSEIDDLGESRGLSVQAQDWNANKHFLSFHHIELKSNPSQPDNPHPTVSNRVSSSSKFSTLIQLKDEILQEKESVILKLRLELVSLQERLQQVDASLGKVPLMQARNTSSNNTCNCFNEYTGRETADAIRHCYVHLPDEKRIQNLEQLLGKAEYKIRDSVLCFEAEKAEFKHKIVELETSLKNTEQTSVDYEESLKTSTEHLEKYKKRVESLERYLEDLPTTQESSESKIAAGMLLVEHDNMTAEVTCLENKLEAKFKTMQEVKRDLEKQTIKKKGQIEKIKKLKENLTKLELSNHELSSTEREELKELKLQVNCSKRDQERFAQLLLESDEKIKKEHEKQRSSIHKMKEKVQKAEEISKNLRQELSMKKQTANQMHTAMMNLSSENQQLVEEKLTLQCQVKTLENIHNNLQEESRACFRLHRESLSVVRDLQSIAEVLIQTAKGDDPNISVLLGSGKEFFSGEIGLNAESLINAGQNEITNNKNVISVELTNKRLAEVRQLRNDIDQLRTMLSDHYAENIGNNCITQ